MIRQAVRQSAWSLVIVAAVGAFTAVLARFEQQPGGNAWDQVMEVLLNPYLIIYPVTAIMLVDGLRRGRQLAAVEIRLRRGSAARWLWAVTGDSVVVAAAAALVLAVLALVTTTGLPWEAGWSQLLVTRLGATPPPPWLLGPLGTVAWVGGVAGIRCLAITSRSRDSWAWAAVAPILWLATLVSFRRDGWLQVLAAPFRLAGVVLEGVVESLTLWAAQVGLVVLLVLLTAGVLSPSPRLKVRPADLAVPLISVGSAALLLTEASTTSWVESVGWVLYGASPKRPLSLAYLGYLMIFLGPVYGFLLRLERELEAQYAVSAVRYGSAWHWWRRRLPSWLGQVLVWPLVAVGLVAAVAAWHCPDWGEGAFWLGYHLVVNTVLQLLVCLLAVALARWLGARPEAGLVALAVLVVAGAVRLPPFALNSASVVFDDPAGPLWATGILVVSALLLVITARLTCDRWGSP